MTKLNIYHNPRCSKSRQTLRLLREQGLTPNIIYYLKTPPAAAELRKILNALALSARELLRTNEILYSELNLDDKALTEEQLIRVMVEHPILIQRPIVTRGEKAVLGRPPENIREIL